MWLLQLSTALDCCRSTPPSLQGKLVNETRCLQCETGGHTAGRQAVSTAIAGWLLAWRREPSPTVLRCAVKTAHPSASPVASGKADLSRS